MEVIDDYPARFVRMRNAQLEWVSRHSITISPYCPYCEGKCEFGARKPERPTRIPTSQREEARTELREGLRQLLLRLYRARLIELEPMKAAAARVATDFEAGELERPPPFVRDETRVVER